jgi:uncharacterized protein YecE (DUF72 family)
MDLQVGTSGFDYRHWDGPFYPDGLPARERLPFYAGRFPVVELNVTIYRMPSGRTFRSWRDRVPDGFTFAVKASRYLTHIRRLRSPRESVEILVERAGTLGDRLGCYLLQLPPDLEMDVDRLDRTLDAFGRARVAVEFRHPSWFTSSVRSCLRAHEAALCIVDRRGPRTPFWATADWTYLRFHAGRASPPGCYGETALRSWVRRIEALPPSVRRGYAYFNNDGYACAVANATRLAELLA